MEKLPSGRIRVRWSEPSGARATAPHTFPSISSARAFLATVQTDILRATYRSPRQTTVTLAVYGTAWIAARPTLKDSTRYQYGIDFRKHVVPYLGDLPLDRIDPATIRTWHSTLSAHLRLTLAASTRPGSQSCRRDGSSTVARSYRIIRAILQTAVDDELLMRNPCRIVGASDPHSAERPTLSVADVGALARAVPPHYRAVVILAGFSGLRAGELAPLRPSDFQLDGVAPTVSVTRRFYRVGGQLNVDTPKSVAGRRTVVLPAFVATELRRHLATYRPDLGRDDFVFVTTGGRDIYDSYSQVIRNGLDLIGRRDCRAHDLRHSALTFASEHGATLATLMQMAGHSTPDAAQRYQHATVEHARRVAAALDRSVAQLLV